MKQVIAAVLLLTFKSPLNKIHISPPNIRDQFSVCVHVLLNLPPTLLSLIVNPRDLSHWSRKPKYLFVVT